jgi:Na+:H+ antiporter, NhaA family
MPSADSTANEILSFHGKAARCQRSSHPVSRDACTDSSANGAAQNHSREDRRVDTLSQFEHWWATPVQFVLLLLGLANAGVPFAQVGPGTYFVLAGLLLGKPIGILLFSRAARLAGASLPAGLHFADLVLVGVTAAIGFTVSLFFATAAFPAGAALAETKMGALLSFSAAPIALIASRLFRRRAASDIAAVARG